MRGKLDTRASWGSLSVSFDCLPAPSFVFSGFTRNRRQASHLGWGFLLGQEKV